MLNLHEIIELENKWLAYSNKKKKKKYIFIYIALILILILLVSFIIFYAYSKGASELEENVRKSNQEIKKQIDEKKVQVEKDKILSSKKNIEVSKKDIDEKPSNILKEEVLPNNTAISHQENESNEILTLNIMDIDVKNTTLSKKQDSIQKQIVKQIPKSIDTDNIVITDLNVKKVEKKDELDDLEYLKIKFSETNSIYFALDIANTYYSKGNYKEARDWSLTANKLNTNNDESWIIFAKSSYKLGFKEQSINSLNNYLKNNNSKKIQDVLELIKKGQL